MYNNYKQPKVLLSIQYEQDAFCTNQGMMKQNQKHKTDHVLNHAQLPKHSSALSFIIITKFNKSIPSIDYFFTFFWTIIPCKKDDPRIKIIY
jgi:hypothetical protein